MKTLFAILLLTAGAASASEGMPESSATVPDESSATLSDESNATESDVAAQVAPDNEAAVPADPPAEMYRTPTPRLSFLDVQAQLAWAQNPRKKADLFAPVAPPKVVAQGFGLLVERRFGP